MNTKSGREFSAANAAAIRQAHGHADKTYQCLDGLVQKLDDPSSEETVLEIEDSGQVRGVDAHLSPMEWQAWATDIREEIRAAIPAMAAAETERQLRKARGRVD